MLYGVRAPSSITSLFFSTILMATSSRSIIRASSPSDKSVPNFQESLGVVSCSLGQISSSSCAFNVGYGVLASNAATNY